MKKKKQQKLIQKIIQSEIPNQQTKEFKELQLHWYKKLDDETNYDDVERIGVQRSKRFNEYSGLIKYESWIMASLYDKNRHNYFQLLRKLSWDAIVTSNSKAFDPSKPSKSLSLTDFEAFSALNNPKSDSNNSSNTIKLQKLSKVDSRILYMIGDGKQIREVSKYLRRHLSHHASRSKTGPKGKPFSVFFVHTRLKKLIESILAGHIVELTPQLQKFMKKNSTSTIKTPQDSEDLEDGGVKKSGLEENSYIYTENNND